MKKDKLVGVPVNFCINLCLKKAANACFFCAKSRSNFDKYHLQQELLTFLLEADDLAYEDFGTGSSYDFFCSFLDDLIQNCFKCKVGKKKKGNIYERIVFKVKKEASGAKVKKEKKSYKKGGKLIVISKFVKD